MSGGDCKPRHENESTKSRAAVFQLLFCIKLGDYAATTHGKLQQAFGDDAMSSDQAFRSQNVFSEGRNLVEGEQRSGRTSATRTGDSTARVGDLIRSDRRLTVRMITDEVIHKPGNCSSDSA
jgi:hypothetical protein